MGRPRKDAALKAKPLLSRPPYAMPLDTIGNVRRELGRLYRASLSGNLDTAEAARLAFILKEVRTALESEELRPDPSQLAPVTFNIVSVPSGCQVDDAGNIVWPEGTVTASPPFEPYVGTPALPALSDQCAPIEPPLPVVEAIDDGKIVVLRPYSDDDSAGAT